MLRMKNINILIFWELKNPTFRKWGGGGYSGGGALPKGGGAWTVCRFIGGLARKRRGCSGGGVDTLMHTMGVLKWKHEPDELIFHCHSEKVF